MLRLLIGASLIYFIGVFWSNDAWKYSFNNMLDKIQLATI